MANWATTNRAARIGMARSVSRSRNRGRSALSQSAVRFEKVFATLCLSLSELQTGISARAPHPPRDRMSGLLPKTQRRRFRSALSIAAHDDDVVAVFVSKTELDKQALAAGSASPKLLP